MIETAISQLTNFYTSKEGIARFVAQVVNEVREGGYNALQLKIFLKAIQKSCEEIEKQTNDLSFTEAEKHGMKSFEFMGAKIELAELGTKYNFSVCGHPALSDINNQIETLAAEKKKIETMLKTITKPMMICDESTGGESVEIHPPVKSSISGLKITIK